MLDLVPEAASIQELELQPRTQLTLLRAGNTPVTHCAPGRT